MCIELLLLDFVVFEKRSPLKVTENLWHEFLEATSTRNMHFAAGQISPQFTYSNQRGTNWKIHKFFTILSYKEITYDHQAKVLYWWVLLRIVRGYTTVRQNQQVSDMIFFFTPISQAMNSLMLTKMYLYVVMNHQSSNHISCHRGWNCRKHVILHGARCNRYFSDHYYMKHVHKFLAGNLVGYAPRLSQLINYLLVIYFLADILIFYKNHPLAP
jgi:hypothetical protein